MNVWEPHDAMCVMKKEGLTVGIEASFVSLWDANIVLIVHVCVWECVWVYVCVCVCEWERVAVARWETHSKKKQIHLVADCFLNLFLSLCEHKCTQNEAWNYDDDYYEYSKYVMQMLKSFYNFTGLT